MKIGEVEIPMRVPGDLDARLRSSMGVSALEAYRILASGPQIPGLLAKFVEPLVEGDSPSRGELTAIIAKAGAGAVRVDLAELYRAACGVEDPSSPPPPAAPVEPEIVTVEGYCSRIMAGESGDSLRGIRATLDDEAVEAEFARINAAGLEAAKVTPGAPPKRKKKGS